MRIQPPNQNNPTNPLFKVAALTLKTLNTRTTRSRKVRVVASLNFKKSEDVRGVTTSANGNSVTVCFSLRIRRATLQIEASFEGSATAIPQLGKVAFVYPLEVKNSLKEEATVSRNANSGYDLKGSANIAADIAKVSPGGRASVGGEKHADKKAKVVGRSVRTFERTNVSATFHENVAHWEINPVRDPTLPDHEPAFLQGEVFRSRSQNRTIDACTVSWKLDSLGGPLIVSGSVYTLMDDLILEDIKFKDDFGDEVHWRKLDNEHGVALLPGFSYSKQKERLARQIIRKHLLSQGMDLDGARVEICKAFA
jgi:hypothetical protein